MSDPTPLESALESQMQLILRYSCAIMSIMELSNSMGFGGADVILCCDVIREMMEKGLRDGEQAIEGFDVLAAFRERLKPGHIIHRAFDFQPFREAARRIDEIIDKASLDEIRAQLRNLSDELKQREPIA